MSPVQMKPLTPTEQKFAQLMNTDLHAYSQKESGKQEVESTTETGKSKSFWGSCCSKKGLKLAGRVTLGIVTLGVSELVRKGITHYKAKKGMYDVEGAHKGILQSGNSAFHISSSGGSIAPQQQRNSTDSTSSSSSGDTWSTVDLND